jgi:23S rRNA (adenine2030-N6)-methyltransferase
MLSYRHAFHAGNHADVLKHLIQVQLLRHLLKKDKATWYIDTHAGAGGYALNSGYATMHREYLSGIARLWTRDDLPQPLADYVALVRSFNPGGDLGFYPGSPLLAYCLLRTQDRLHLCETHPADNRLLRQNFETAGKRVLVQATDGFGALKALLPPAPRRALVLIDPPYEDKHDYRRAVSALDESLKRFASGIYALWYPNLSRTESRQFPSRLKQLDVHAWLHVVLNVRGANTADSGMRGSGMFVLNPPWGLRETLEQTMPCLADWLGQDGCAGFVVEYHEKPSAPTPVPDPPGHHANRPRNAT